MKMAAPGKMRLYELKTGDVEDVVPDADQLGDPVRIISLVGSHLSSSQNSEVGFSIREDKSTVNFKCQTTKEKDEWFVGLAEVPGLFRDVDDYYVIGDRWGSGATCYVQECYSRFTGRKYAIKSRIHENRESTVAMHNELRILQICLKDPHPAIPRLVDFFFDTKGEIKLVTELMEGGEVFDDVVNGRHMDEEKAKIVFRQIASGVAHLHSLGIAHRDLKPENLMYCKRSPSQTPGNAKEYHDLEVKIMDYDLAKVNYCPEWLANTPCGTLTYMAPEMIQHRKYSLSVDAWSLGVCLYVFLSGHVPFRGTEKQEIFDNVCLGSLDMENPPWNTISDEAKDLIQKLLKVDPLERMSVAETLSHPWLQRASDMRRRSASDSIHITGKVLETLPFIQESPQLSALDSYDFGADASPSDSFQRDDVNVPELRVMMDVVGIPAGLQDSKKARALGTPSSPQSKGKTPAECLPHSDSFADLEGSFLGEDDLSDADLEENFNE